MLKNIKILFSYNELLWNLTFREIKIRYKQSVLGLLWVILQPLAMMLIFTVIFSCFVKIPTDGIPYPIFSLVGLLPWTFFAAALSFAIPSIVSNINLVTKVYFPREIFPIASTFAAFFDFFISLAVLLLFLLYYHIPLTINMLYTLPILILQIILTIAIVLFASALNVYYRDVKYTLPLMIQLWMYLSPVIYPISAVPERFKFFYMLNPMAPIIDGYRRVILKGAAPDFIYLLIALVISIGIFAVSYKLFKKLEMSFPDVI